MLRWLVQRLITNIFLSCVFLLLLLFLFCLRLCLISKRMSVGWAVLTVRYTCTAGVSSCWSRWDPGLCDGSCKNLTWTWADESRNRTDASRVLWPQRRHCIELYVSRLLCSESLLDAFTYLNWWKSDLDLIHSTQMFFIFLCDLIWICLLYLFKMLEVTQDSISTCRITRPNLFSLAASVTLLARSTEHVLCWFSLTRRTYISSSFDKVF